MHHNSRAQSAIVWPPLIHRLKSLHIQGRRSVRIVDTHCGSGDLLIAAARYARTLGFLAIEGRGIDTNHRLIAKARRAAAQENDPAIGLHFETGKARAALHDETAFPADLLITDIKRHDPLLDALAKSAADLVLTASADRPQA